MSDLIGQQASLAAAGARQNKKRTLRMGDRFFLYLIEVVKKIVHTSEIKGEIPRTQYLIQDSLEELSIGINGDTHGIVFLGINSVGVPLN